MSIATALQALLTAKTDIANTITQRGGTVNSGDGFSDFASCIGTIPQGSGEPSEPSTPVNFEIHRVTVPETLTSSNKTLLSNVQFIKEHLNDDGFIAIIISATFIPTGTAGVGFVYRGNRPLCEKIGGGGYYYGVKHQTNGSSVGTQLTSAKFPTAEWNGYHNVDSTGRLYVNCNTTSGVYPAGEYFVILAVIE